MKNIVLSTYHPGSVPEWAHDTPLQHPSGVWGRSKLLAYAKERIQPGEIIVDLGCGAGYVTNLLAKCVGDSGHVFGYDIVPEFIAHAQREYAPQGNLSFAVHDLNNPLPHADESVDRFVSAMVLQNLYEAEMLRSLTEVRRCLKRNGETVFLTLHPYIWREPWRLDFIQYNQDEVAYWRASQKDDMLFRGSVNNSGGGSKKVFMLTHSRKQIDSILQRVGLVITLDLPICVDRATAELFFGPDQDRIYPDHPLFWMFSVQRNG